MEYTIQEVRDKIEYMQTKFNIDISLDETNEPFSMNISTKDKSFVYYHNPTPDVAMIFLFGFMKGYEFRQHKELYKMV